MTDQDPGASADREPTTTPPNGATGAGMPSGITLAWRAPLVAYAVTLAASLLLGVLLLVALSSSGSTSEEVEGLSSAAEGLLAWLAVPVQLAAMALGGRVQLGDADDFSISLLAPPLALTVTYLVVLGRLASSAEARLPSRSRQDRVITSGAAAAGTAIVVSLVTRLLALRVDGSAIHALSVSLVLGTLLLTFLADLVGREMRSAGTPAIVRRWEPVAVTWLSHVGIWLAVSLPVLFVFSWIHEGFKVAMTAPLWWPTAGLWTYALGHLSAIGTLGTYTYAWSDGGALLALVLLLGAVVAAVFASVVWHLRSRRTAADLATPASWARLPIGFAVGGLVVTIVSMVRIGGGLSGIGGAVTIMPAVWTCVLLALWGLAAEWLSRSVAPRIGQALPAPLAARLQGPALVPAAVRHEQPSAQPAAEPLTAEQARRVRRIVIAGGAGLALLVIGAVAVSVVGSTYFTPERAAQSYVDAVSDGDVEAVAAALPDDEELSTALLTDEVLEGVTDRPTDYTLGEVTSLFDRTMVEVTAEDGVGGESFIELEKGGRKFGLFQEWKVVGGLTSRLSVARGDDVAVNGVTVAADQGGAGTFAVVPGTYSVDPFAGNEWLAGAVSEVTVPLGGHEFPEIASPEPSDAFLQRVDDEIDSWLDDCMARTEAEPDGCPQSVYAYGNVRNLTWQLTDAPEVDYDFFDPTFPMSLYVTDGTATATYEVDESYGFGAPEWVEETEESTLGFSVEVDLEGGQLEVVPQAY